MFLYITRQIRKAIAKGSKPVYCALYGHEKETTPWIRRLRIAASFVLGVLLAYLMWLLISVNINVSKLYGHIVGEGKVTVVFLLLNGVLYVISPTARAVTLLIFVGLLGRAGRRYFRAVAFALIIAGPIDNLVRNAGEVARVFACTTELTYNLTKTRFDLMARPFTNTLQYMADDLIEIQGNFKQLQDILNDLKYAVKHSDIEDDKFGNNKPRRAANMSVEESNSTSSNAQLPKAADVQSQFLRNLRNRCKHQLRSGHKVCQEVFLQGYRKCSSNFPDWLASAICWPYRVDIICKVNMFGNPDKICDASKVVPANFGRTYVKMLQAEHELFENSTNIEITYQVQNISTSAQLQSAQATAEEVIAEFERKRRTFKWVMMIIEKILCLMILGVLYASFEYHYRYRVNIEFDNFYITDYFEHVDARRKDAKLRSLLPLHNHEKSRLVNVNRICSHKQEQANYICLYMLQFSLEVVTAGLFLLLDHMVVTLLTIIHRRSLITYHQEGEHEVRFRINGTGLMARLLRTTMKNFNIHERVSTSLSNEACLPVAHVLPSSFYFKLILLYLAIVLLIFQSAAFMGLRRVICSYFYYKREKQRILFLYSSILRKRNSIVDEMHIRAEENMALRHVQGEVNILFVLRMSYPNKFGWLRNYNVAKRKCLTCNALEDSKFVYCPRCGFPFCWECSRDMKRMCVNCEELLPIDATTDKAITSDETSVDVYTYRKEK
ncbi:protein sneaky [Drosophila grimshawi]|uniref:GH14425 n=1 Tax=Drosophila grimshawi TaxID=7222 RepID=B4J164_DROGR|nr:protein sneaky [Drosophila grimshawi]EDV97933.1 GH14425 [Drosophila grimshawi]